MKRTDLPAPVRRMLNDISYVTIASVCSDGRPWNTPVYGVFDDNLNLYWASWTNNQHSQNIANQPAIFVVVYDSRAPEGKALGVYLEMTAEVLTDKAAIRRARQVYTSKFGETLTHEPFTGECPRRLYQATMHRIWLNADAYIQGNFIDVRRELTPAEE